MLYNMVFNRQEAEEELRGSRPTRTEIWWFKEAKSMELVEIQWRAGNNGIYGLMGVQIDIKFQLKAWGDR